MGGDIHVAMSFPSASIRDCADSPKSAPGTPNAPTARIESFALGLTKAIRRKDYRVSGVNYLVDLAVRHLCTEIMDPHLLDVTEVVSVCQPPSDGYSHD